jgi:chromate transporter
MLVTTLAVFGPSSIVTVIALRLWHRFENPTWRNAIKAGLVPISAGLVAASASIIARTVDHAWIFAAITTAGALIAIRTKIHPLWLLGAGAAIGWTGFGQ